MLKKLLKSLFNNTSDNERKVIENYLSMSENSYDLEFRIRELEKRHESVYIEAEPGDALFFHANLLHSSDANKSQNSRRTLIVCFNTKSNNPYKEIGHASYNQLKVANHNSIMEYKID